jgi:hypothetical protein
MTYNVYITGCFSSQQHINASSREEAVCTALSNLNNQPSDLITIDINEVEADLQQSYVSLKAYYSSFNQTQAEEGYTPMHSLLANQQPNYTPFIR